LTEPVKFRVEELSVAYRQLTALSGVTMDILANRATAIMGPSGCGKSTFLKTLNRMNDLVDGARVSGLVLMDGEDIYRTQLDIAQLRKRVGMVFQRPNPFPMSIYDNVAYGPRVHGMRDRATLNDLVEQCLRSAALWDEVKDRLTGPALDLSGGQQQRLVIARLLAVEPEVLLMDEPASSLDPISAAKLEELIHQLKQRYTVIIVTHNLQQAARVSDYTAFFLDGRLIELDNTAKLFTNPRDKRTEDYITGRFG
jgi:phosphate transport system ATP-binding protein